MLEMYRTRKVRILNGAHTSFVPYALMSGFTTVKECVEDKVMRTYIRDCLLEEIVPTLDLPKDELSAYANNVLVRFANPYITHYLSAIAVNSVSKFKVSVLPSILEYIARNEDKMPTRLMFSFAKLLDFYLTDMTNDSPEVERFMKESNTEEILSNEQLWGYNLGFLTEEVERHRRHVAKN